MELDKLIDKVAHPRFNFVHINKDLKLAIQVLNVNLYIEEYSNIIEIQRNFYITMFDGDKTYKLNLFLKITYDKVYKKISSIYVAEKDKTVTENHNSVMSRTRKIEDDEYSKDLKMFLPFCYNALLYEYKERYLQNGN